MAPAAQEINDNEKMDVEQLNDAEEDEVEIAEGKAGDNENLDVGQNNDAKEEEDVTRANEEVNNDEVDERGDEKDSIMDVESNKELEDDSPDDDRPRIDKDNVSICNWDATIDVIRAHADRLLLSLSDGGFQFLLSGVRANAGLKAGRYFYEVKIFESRNFAEQAVPQVLRLGFSSSSITVLGEGANAIFFDMDGTVVHDKSKTRVTDRFQPLQVFGVLLNLDSENSNANSISLFRDGIRACKPYFLPECLRGQTLFPIINYRNVMLEVNVGPMPLMPLPFSCRMLADASFEDVEVAQLPCSDGNYEVLFPVGLPDEGTFDWLDAYLKEHPDCIELSDQAILDWAQKSALIRQKGYAWRECNDRPGMGFGIREMDTLSARHLIQSTAPLLKRNCIVMEVRNNLLSHERRKALEHFDRMRFKRVAVVVMGEPTDTHKQFVHQKMRLKKRERAVNDVKRQWALEERKRERNGGSKQDDAEVEEAKLSLEDAVKKAGSVELSEEELNQWFRKSPYADLTQKQISHSFSDFTLPTEDEGFDEIRYEWQGQEESNRYLKEWVAKHKLTQKVEDLVPGAWFKENWAEWCKVVQEWRRKYNDFRDSSRRKSTLKKTSEKKLAIETGESRNGGIANDESDAEVDREDVKMIDVDYLDIFRVEDVCDVGTGEPLFANFESEDWAMLNLRFELHLLVHAFRHDMNDPERSSFHEHNLQFYYSKYHQKQLDFRNYGCATMRELLDLVNDTIEIVPKNAVVDHLLSDDTPLENFVKLTEEHRRERQRCIDAGDSTAVLKFSKPPIRQPQPPGVGGHPLHATPLAQQTRNRIPPTESGSGYGLGGMRGSSGGNGYGAPQTYRGHGHQGLPFSGEKRQYSSALSQGYQQTKHARIAAGGTLDSNQSRGVPPAGCLSRISGNRHGLSTSGIYPSGGGSGCSGSYRR